MPGLAPFLVSTPGILGMLGVGSMIDQNVQSKNAIKNQQNMEASALAQTTANANAAQGNLSKYIGANPGPAGAGNAPAAPAYSGANIPIAGRPGGGITPGGGPGPGMMSMPGSGAQPGPGMTAAPGGSQLPPAVLAMLRQALQGGTA